MILEIFLNVFICWNIFIAPFLESIQEGVTLALNVVKETWVFCCRTHILTLFQDSKKKHLTLIHFTFGHRFGFVKFENFSQFWIRTEWHCKKHFSFSFSFLLPLFFMKYTQIANWPILHVLQYFWKRHLRLHGKVYSRIFYSNIFGKSKPY